MTLLTRTYLCPYLLGTANVLTYYTHYTNVFTYLELPVLMSLLIKNY